MLRRTGGGGNDAKLVLRGYGACREGRARWELDAECRDRGIFQEDGGTMLKLATNWRRANEQHRAARSAGPASLQY
jgi:hypothetical protein